MHSLRAEGAEEEEEGVAGLAAGEEEGSGDGVEGEEEAEAGSGTEAEGDEGTVEVRGVIQGCIVVLG